MTSSGSTSPLQFSSVARSAIMGLFVMLSHTDSTMTEDLLKAYVSCLIHSGSLMSKEVI